MPRILIVDPNSKGGHNDYCHSLSKILSAKYDVNYLNGEKQKNENSNYNHININENNKLLFYIKYYFEINKHIKKGYEIHFQAINYFMMIVIFFLNKKKNFHYTLHNLVPHDLNMKEILKYKILFNLIKKPYFTNIYFHYEYFKNIKNEIFDNLPLLIKDKMTFVPHHMFKENIFDNKLNILNTVNILIFGVIRDNKGIIEFFKLISDMKLEVKNIYFTIAGKFIDYDEDLLAEYKIKYNITVVNKFISKEEKKALFCDTHFILLPYKKSFLAQSGLILDAYEYKKPLIVSSNISLKYLIEIEKTGFVFEKMSLKNLFQSLIFNNNEYRDKVENIEHILQTKYSRIVICNEYYIDKQ